jgi:RND family efflux transporter MFP subunit
VGPAPRPLPAQPGVPVVKGSARRRGAAAACVVVAGVGIGVGVAAASSSGPVAYRTATAATSGVTQTLAVDGTLEPVNRATAAFQVAGTVSSVAVAPGQHVAAGQTLATLDPTALQGTLTAARAALTAAQARLTADEMGESTAASSPATGSGSTAAAASWTSAPEGAVVLTAAVQPAGRIGADQQAVVAAQKAVDADLATAAADLADVRSACGGGGSGPPPSTTSTTSTSTSSTTSVPASSTTTTIPGPSASSPGAACARALETAEQAEQQVATAQHRLAAAESALAQALTTAVRSAGSSGAAAGTAAPRGSGATPGASTGARSTATPSASTSTASPAQLASDQATIDSDEAAVARADESLAAATLVSPIAGSVAAVTLTPGQSVGAGSASFAVTIVNSSDWEMTADLTTTEVQQAATGQAAAITVDGAPGALSGQVTRVGPVTLSSSSYNYPVVITITSPVGQMPAGASAHATIDLAEAGNTLVVPTSAVHTTAPGSSYVYLDQAGREVRRGVHTGLVGAVYTQITSGLSAGQVVVLADPSQAVPASSTGSALRAFAGIGGGFRVGGGGGRGAGGLRGG